MEPQNLIQTKQLANRVLQSKIVDAKNDHAWFIYDEQELLSNISSIRSLQQSLFGKKAGNLLVSLKANPNPYLLKALVSHIDGFDVSSENELALALAVEKQKAFTLSGPAKLKSLLAHPAVSVIHLDSLEELEACLKLPTASRPPEITLRLSPDSWSTKLGMNEQESDVAVAILKKSNRRLSGLHIYLGREAFDDARLHTAIQLAQGFLSRHAAIFSKKELFLGLGLAGRSQASRWQATPTSEILQDFDKAHVEIGRGVFESAGLYVAQVLSVKRLRQRPVVIINGGNHHFAEKLLSETGEEAAYFPFSLRQSSHSNKEVLLAGSLCQDRDVLHPSCPLPSDLQRGDWLVFPNRGAYGLTASNQQFIGQSAVGEILVQKNGELLSVSPQNWRGYHLAFADFGTES